MTRSRTLAFLMTLLAGCSTLTQDSLDTRFGPADPTRYDRPPIVATAPQAVSYERDVKPILDRRCVVCHGCYDAPCQLKLGSYDGITRGSSKSQIYASLRLTEAPLTRLNIDAHSPSQWRDKGFDAVLNERTPSPENHLAASVLYRSLQLKQAHPLPAVAVLPEGFDFSLDRAQSCPKLGEYGAYAKAQPLAGMPYGLPGLAPREMNVITRWLSAGAPDDAPVALPAAVARQVAEWERFLNGASLKERLMSRYLYEHLFLGHLVFDGDAQRHVFRLVRSTTAPGAPIVRVPTRRAYDDPGVPQVHYRLQLDRETLVAKTHMPYALSPQRMARWQSLFLAPAYTVDRLPSYDIEQASNPFITFAAIPAASRYRFLLDEAEFFISTFIKGPVCRGQTALNVINDRFWVYFVDPDVNADAEGAQVIAREAPQLRLPAGVGSNPNPLTALIAWRQLAAAEDRVLAAKGAELNKRFTGSRRIDQSLIWRGDGHNTNAALTVFRHFDSASVVRGQVGEPPKTAWVIGYTLLERIYYLLVAGYDVFGNTAHQLDTRLYMDFLRMEGESNFLMLMPKAARDPLRDHWYRGSSDEVKARVNGGPHRFEGESGIAFQPGDPRNQQLQLYEKLQAHLAPVIDTRFSLAREPDAALRQGLQQIAAVQGASLAWWPQVALLRIDDPKQPPRYFTLLHNNGHLNVSTLLNESSALLREEDSMTVVPGFIGSYPNALLRASSAELPALARSIASLRSEADYRALADRHVIRRTDPNFWAASDALMDAYQRWSPGEAGLFDYGRLENR